MIVVVVVVEVVEDCHDGGSDGLKVVYGGGSEGVGY